MCKFVKLKKVVVKAFFSVLYITLILSFTANNISAENLLEFYFSPREETASSDTDIISDFIDALPDEIKENLPDEIINGDIGSAADNITDFRSIWSRITDEVKSGLFPAITDTAFIFGLLLLSSLIKTFKNMTGSTGQITTAVLNTGIILSIIATGIVSVNSVEHFKNLICNIMNGMVPALTVFYAASGNISTGAIQSSGIMLLVTLCQNLFTIVLLPAVRICLMLGIVDSVFPEVGIKPIGTAFKNIATWIMIISVTLFSFVLNLQNSIAQSADSFGARSIKFAVGNLVPIIGGAVSDSLGTLGGSLSVLKSVGGTAAIVAVIIILIPCIVGLAVRRFSLFACKTAAGVLKCSEEENLIGELGSAVSLMLAFAVAISLAFIYTLTMFASSTVAVIG